MPTLKQWNVEKTTDGWHVSNGLTVIGAFTNWASAANRCAAANVRDGYPPSYTQFGEPGTSVFAVAASIADLKQPWWLAYEAADMALAYVRENWPRVASQLSRIEATGEGLPDWHPLDWQTRPTLQEQDERPASRG